MQEREIKILSVGISCGGKRQELKKILERMRSGKVTKVFTPNTQMLLKAQKSKAIAKTLNSAQIKIPDGIGVSIASKILKSSPIERIAGIDLGEDILKISEKHGYSIFLLGGKPGRAERARQNLLKKYPSLKICGCHHGYFDKQGIENQKVKEKINKSSPDVLFFCFGFPTQEEWINKNLSDLNSVKIAMGLGGSIDVWSGDIERAPRAVQKIGFEWLWRAVKEPRRMKILLDIPIFFTLVYAQKRALRVKAKRS